MDKDWMELERISRQIERDSRRYPEQRTEAGT